MNLELQEIVSASPGIVATSSLCSYFRLFHYFQIIFAKGAHFTLSELTHSEYDVIGLDWTMDINDARLTAPGQTLMGNLDPCALYANEVFYLCLSLMLQSATRSIFINARECMSASHRLRISLHISCWEHYCTQSDLIAGIVFPTICSQAQEMFNEACIRTFLVRPRFNH